MLELRTITARDGWDDTVRGFAASDLRQSYGWGELRRSQGWAPLRVAAFEGSRCLAAMSVLARPIPGLGAVLYAPRGPLIECDGSTAWEALRALVRHVGAATRAIFLRVSPAVPVEAADGLSGLQEMGFSRLPDFWSVWNTPRNIMRLSLDGSERDILDRMTRRRRRYIVNRAKRAVVVERESGLAAARVFHAMLLEHGARNRYPVRGWPYFEAFYREFCGDDVLALMIARVRETPVAAALGVRFGTVAYAIYAPSTPAARELRASETVEWEWIRWAKAAGCGEIDFGSSGTDVPPRESDPGYGRYRFKQELGCALTLYAGYYDYVFAPHRYRAVRLAERHLLPRARASVSRLPRILRTRAGRQPSHQVV
jgi:lipid II:glycine glycyltransferase (peptidoglycan interpeptide bridge formation enzyme)